MFSPIEALIDRLPRKVMGNILRAMQLVSGVSLLVYAIGTFYSFELVFPWFNLGFVKSSQAIMIICALVQIFCGVWHCARCVFLASWPAAVAFSYVAICAKTDPVTHYDLWGAAALLGLVNWFVASVSSRKMKRASCGQSATSHK